MYVNFLAKKALINLTDDEKLNKPKVIMIEIVQNIIDISRLEKEFKNSFILSG